MKNKKDTAVIAGTLDPASFGSLAEFDAAFEAERSRLADLAQKRQDFVTAQEAKANEKITALPEQFGVDSVEEVYAIIGKFVRANRNGTGGTNRLTDETRTKIKGLLETNKPGTDRRYQLSEISAMTGVSVPTIHKIKKGMGLVNGRNSATPEATASESTEAAPTESASVEAGEAVTA